MPSLPNPASLLFAVHAPGIFRRLGLACLALLLSACLSGCVLAQETQYASGFNMYGSRGFTRVLLVGDSMSVGGFGEGMQDYLNAHFGRANVAIYAACGSSPEHWLASEPPYQTHCGYREQTPRTNILYDFLNGRRPQPALAPKVEDLVAILHPRTVIVQLGTNWMDPMTAGGDGMKYGEILYRFINALRSESGTVRQIVWVSPPDSTHYPRSVQQTVLNLIVAGGKKYGYTVVDSTKYTHYTGRSGSDGVHYNSEEGRAWAAGVIREIAPLLGR